jgi:hypothetical protein
MGAGWDLDAWLDQAYEDRYMLDDDDDSAECDDDDEGDS